jgi:hypothetical protein
VRTLYIFSHLKLIRGERGNASLSDIIEGAYSIHRKLGFLSTMWRKRAI